VAFHIDYYINVKVEELVHVKILNACIHASDGEFLKKLIKMT